MKAVTSIEQPDNRILNRYGLEHMYIRGKKRILLFTMLPGLTNI